MLVICDHFSKWAQAYPLNSTTAETVAGKLVEFGYAYGLCTNLLSDQGKNFQSTVLKQVLLALDIHQLRTTPYHPECDGLSERFIRTLKAMLRCHIDTNQNDWDLKLSALCFAYNTAVHKTTKYSPYEIVFGRKPIIPLDFVLNSFHLDDNGELNPNQPDVIDHDEEVIRGLEQSPSPYEVERYVSELTTHLKEVYDTVAGNQDIAVQKQALNFDRNLHPFEYKIGELVLRLDKTSKVGMSKKLSPHYYSTPFVVVSRPSTTTYVIRKAGKPSSRAITVHHNNLKRYFLAPSCLEASNPCPSQQLPEASGSQSTQREEPEPRGNPIAKPAPKRPVGRPRKQPNGVPPIRPTQPSTSAGSTSIHFPSNLSNSNLSSPTPTNNTPAPILIWSQSKRLVRRPVRFEADQK